MSDWLPLPALLRGYFRNDNVRYDVTLIAFRMSTGLLEYLSTAGNACPAGMFTHFDPL